MATHYSIPAWRIPGTGEPGGLQSMALQKSQTCLSVHACSGMERGNSSGGLNTRVGQTSALSSVLMPAATEEGLCSNSDYVFIGVVSDFYR